MIEEEICIDAGDVTLAGTVARPEGAAKGVVVFVHGSGPMDRDQNTKGIKLNTFRVLAEALAAAGVASVRYDKRGIGASGGTFAQAGQADLIADAQAAIGYAKEAALGPVLLVGHSEGTYLSAAAASALGEDVAGLVLLCPYVTPGDEILMWQASWGDKMVDEIPGLKGRLVRGVMGLLGRPSQIQARLIRKTLASDGGYVRVGLKRLPARWLKDFITADVAAAYRGVRQPALLLVASHDVQCPPEDGGKIAQMLPRAELLVIEGLSHILRPAGEAGFAGYAAQLRAPMDDRVTEAVVSWVTTRLGR